MKTMYTILALALSVTAVAPALAQTATQNAAQNAAGAGGSAGSITTSPGKPTTPSPTARAKRAAIDNHSSARAAANAGGQ